MSSISKTYRYPSNLQIGFPEGLEEIKFLRGIDGFNYLSVKNAKKSKISLPTEFEETAIPEEFLEEKRLVKYTEVEAMRKELQFQSTEYNGVKLSTSQMARQNMLEVIELLRNSDQETHYWQDIKGDSQQFNREDFRKILSMISLRDSKFYFVEAEIRKIIKSSSDIDFLELLNIKSLWDEQEQKYNKSQEAAAIQN